MLKLTKNEFNFIVCSLIIISIAFIVMLMIKDMQDDQSVLASEHKQAIEYAPIIEIEMIAYDSNKLVNINDTNDIVEIHGVAIEVGEVYIASFKNDIPIKIVNVKDIK